MTTKERIIAIVCASLLILCLCAGLVAGTASASPLYHCGTSCKIHDKTTLSWRDLNWDDKKSDKAPQDSQVKEYNGVKVFIPSQYQEDQAHEWAESQRQEEDHEDQYKTMPDFRKNMRCLMYRIEYIGRHGATTPRPLRHLHGCDKWAHVYWYWQRRSELLNLMGDR